MDEKTALLCIVCPTGCRIQAVRNPDGSFAISGSGCKRGMQFAMDEMTHPMRSLTTTVRTAFEGVPVLPVRTDGEIPKEKVPDAMRELSRVVVGTRLACGDVVLQDVAGCGCRVIATSNILASGDF